MKHATFIKHLKKNGCKLQREGGKYSVFYNPKNNKTATVPRHPEIQNILANIICKQLEIDKI